MHCGSVPCYSSGFVKGFVHDGNIDSSRIIWSVPAMAKRRIFVSRRNCVVVCQDESSSAKKNSRRVSYKRRQQLPPPKGLLSSMDSTDHHVQFEALHKKTMHHYHHHKTRAFEFLCENNNEDTKDPGFLVSSDGTWSSRILMQIQVDLMWLSLHSSSFRLDRLLGRKQGHAQALAVAVDLQKRDSSQNQHKIFGFKENQWLENGIGRMGFFQWLERLKETYGASFMLLVVLGYCTHGFRCFPWLAMCYFFKDHLQVDPGTMQFLMSTTMLPMLAKPVYGLVSDSIYIRGAHRLPYLMIAASLQVVAWGAIVMHPGVSSSVAVLTAALTMSNMGAAISEVVNDALVAEAVKSKQGARQGELQSLAWLALATGGLVGNLMGGLALQRMDTTTMFSIFMMLVGAQLVLCTTTRETSFGLGVQHHQQPSLLKEKAVLLPQKTKRIYAKFANTDDDDEGTHSPVECVNLAEIESKPQPLDMQGQLALLSSMLRKPAVYRPLVWFLSSYAVIPLLGSSMFFYQTQHLGLDSSVIGLVKVVGQSGLVAGSMLYNKKLKKVPLRKLFGGLQVLMSLCMLSDIVLVTRLNVQMGIPDEFFVLGASAFVEAIAQFKILPFMVLLAQLCPAGSEGSLLAFFMSAQCLAALTSAYLGVGLASFLHISANSFEELPLGILVQAGFALLPVLWINFIPAEPVTHDDASKQLSDSSTQVHND